MKKPSRKDQLLIFALKNTKIDTYLSISEFKLELNRLRAIKKGLIWYDTNRNVKFPAIITNFVVLSNMFPCLVLNQLLFAEVPEKQWPKLKTILSWLNLLIVEDKLKLPTQPPVTVRLNRIKIDEKFIKVLEDEIRSK